MAQKQVIICDAENRSKVIEDVGPLHTSLRSLGSWIERKKEGWRERGRGQTKDFMTQL